MNTQMHERFKAKTWEIANRLRRAYQPSQYRLVVWRRLDCVLEPTRNDVMRPERLPWLVFRPFRIPYAKHGKNGATSCAIKGNKRQIGFTGRAL